MKILHTADWHIGKRLPPFTREDEQRAVLKEIIEIAEREKVDVTIIAGDVFDVSVPPASAEEIFFSAVNELARHCLVVAVAGNHDDGERLGAPDAIAKHIGVFLAGGFDCTALGGGKVEGRKGGIVYRKGDERLNILLCPYLTESRRGDPPAENFADYVKAVLKEMADDVFGEGCNIAVAHLFMLGSASLGEERELGAAKLLPLDVLPKCDYVALGHVHKPLKLADNVRYSGSILGYSFDSDVTRQVLIYDTETKRVAEIPLKNGKRLVTARVKSFEEGLAFLASAGEDYVKIVYDSPEPLSAGNVSELERAGKLVLLEVVPQGVKREITRRSHRTSEELFREFYASVCGGEEPSDNLVKEFIALIGE